MENVEYTGKADFILAMAIIAVGGTIANIALYYISGYYYGLL